MMARIAAPGVLAVALSGICLYGGCQKNRSGTLNAKGGSHPSAASRATRVDGDRGVVALGRIEPADGIVEVSGLVGDRLLTLSVTTGDSVTQGQVIARMASHEQRRLEHAAAEAQLREAEARFRSEEKLAATRIRVADLAVAEAESVALDIAAQKTKLELSHRNREIAAKDLERLQTLREQRSTLVTDQELERQRILLDRATAEVAATESMLKKLEQTQELRLNAARADAESARVGREHVLTAVPLESLRKQMELAAANLRLTEILAPRDGTVLNVLARAGETLRGPLVHLADLSRMVVVAEVYETEIKRIRVGQAAIVRSSAFEKPFEETGLRGTVRRVAQTIVTPALRSLDPLAMADRRVVEVVIDLDADGAVQAARLCNLQVDVRIVDDSSQVPPPTP